MRSTCATGPIRSMSLFGTYATTVLVPSTNINAMTGAAMNTERVTDRAGALVSPARMAMYSKPPTAPKIVIMKMPPVLCTHLPTDRPMVDVTTINDRISADDNATNQLLLVIH